MIFVIYYKLQINMNLQQLPLYDNIYDHVNKSNLINMDLNIEQKNKISGPVTMSDVG